MSDILVPNLAAYKIDSSQGHSVCKGNPEKEVPGSASTPSEVRLSIELTQEVLVGS
jgi:hypothetical protein